MKIVAISLYPPDIDKTKILLPHGQTDQKVYLTLP